MLKHLLEVSQKVLRGKDAEQVRLTASAIAPMAALSEWVKLVSQVTHTLCSALCSHLFFNFVLASKFVCCCCTGNVAFQAMHCRFSLLQRSMQTFHHEVLSLYPLHHLPELIMDASPWPMAYLLVPLVQLSCCMQNLNYLQQTDAAGRTALMHAAAVMPATEDADESFTRMLLSVGKQDRASLLVAADSEGKHIKLL